MSTFKRLLRQSPLFLGVSLALSNPIYAQQQEFLGQYYSQTVYAGEIRASGVNTAVLTDEDLVRGNNDGETIFQEAGNSTADPLQIFNGYFSYDTVNFRVIPVEGEASVTVFFNDGTAIYDVSSIIDRFISYGVTTSLYLLDERALAEANKSLSDIVDISFNEFIDHDLNYSDFGFGNAIDEDTGSSDEPTDTDDEITDDTSADDRNFIVGTNGRDDLRGTSGDDVILGLGGSRDVLAGNAGRDIFVFGSETASGSKDRDIIVDFDIIDDTIVLENGASIVSSRVKDGTLIIRLNGSDRDIIRLRNVDTDVSSLNIIELNGDFE